MGADAEGLGRLIRFAERIPNGRLIYDQGEIPDRIFVVLRGLLQFEIVGDDGAVTVVGSVEPGQMAGHVAAMNARPTSAAARAMDDAVLLSIPLTALAEAFQDAPGLAVQLSDALNSAGAGAQHAAAGETPRRVVRDTVVIPVARPVDEQFFFIDSADCPVCDASFEYLRIRTRGVRPAQRDTDLRVAYTTIDPSWYAPVSCPKCAFTSYRDDFYDVSESERDDLVAATEGRRAMFAKPLTGPRTAADAEVALELAMHSYAVRRPNERRHAVLLHRRAWLARAKGDSAEEMSWLARARDAYQTAYESDPDVSDEGALRAAYLIGDLTLRLGDPHTAGRWLEVCLKVGAGEQSGLVRMARERLHDAREAAKAIAETAAAS